VDNESRNVPGKPEPAVGMYMVPEDPLMEF
jgi:hypothetical protein